MLPPGFEPGWPAFFNPPLSYQCMTGVITKGRNDWPDYTTGALFEQP